MAHAQTKARPPRAAIVVHVPCFAAGFDGNSSLLGAWTEKIFERFQFSHRYTSHGCLLLSPRWLRLRTRGGAPSFHSERGDGHCLRCEGVSLFADVDRWRRREQLARGSLIPSLRITNSRAPSLSGHYSLRRYYVPILHPLPFGRLPDSGYTTYLPPSTSRRGEESFSSCSAHPCHRAVATTPPGRSIASARLRWTVMP
jgi:hypothetical protein